MFFLKKNLVNNDNILSHPVTDSKTKIVTDFYKITPFPNYKINDDRRTILEKGNRNALAKQFKKYIGNNKTILEVGCGTGQLSNYFAIDNNIKVISLDPTLESIKLAKNFSIKNYISNITYLNVDIFDDVLSDECFDFIWCNGVLHHTKSPYLAFKTLIKSLKKNGYVLIGLYNRFGRLRTIIIKYLTKIFGLKILKILDPTLKKLKLDEDEKNAWVRDQYFHPIESLHTIDEVLKWFKENNIEFISSIPSSDFDYDYKDIFEKKSEGTYYSRIINQISMVFSQLGSDGGLFILIGRKY
jgi:2-polyprenyl-3-methyl-5-hydroxy-6-metoxy-1,4-benzoquinol methylase